MARGGLRFKLMQLKEIPLQMLISSPKQNVDEQVKHIPGTCFGHGKCQQSAIKTMGLMHYMIGGLYLLTSFEFLLT
mgnify:FL=1